MRLEWWSSTGEWAHEDEKRLLAMVGLSLLLHAGVLWMWKSPVSTGSFTKTALTVLLPERLDSRPAVPDAAERAPLPDKASSPVLVPPLVTKPAVATPELAPVKALPPTLPPPLSAAPPAQPVLAQQDRVDVAGDGVKMIVRVNALGEVTQIFWDRLPAIDNEQFNRLEAIVRLRRYGPHVSDRSITEIIDVRALLSLPPTRSDAVSRNNAVQPAPTGE